MRQIFLTVFIALLGLTASVYAQDFQTGSSMMNSGSSYSSSVSEVGASAATDMASTTYSGRVLRKDGEDSGWGEGAEYKESQDEGFPIGTPYVMLAFALIAAGVVAYRTRNAHVKSAK